MDNLNDNNHIFFSQDSNVGINFAYFTNDIMREIIHE